MIKVGQIRLTESASNCTVMFGIPFCQRNDRLICCHGRCGRNVRLLPTAIAVWIPESIFTTLEDVSFCGAVPRYSPFLFLDYFVIRKDAIWLQSAWNASFLSLIYGGAGKVFAHTCI